MDKRMSTCSLKLDKSGSRDINLERRALMICNGSVFTDHSGGMVYPSEARVVVCYFPLSSVCGAPRER